MYKAIVRVVTGAWIIASTRRSHLLKPLFDLKYLTMPMVITNKKAKVTDNRNPEATPYKRALWEYSRIS